MPCSAGCRRAKAVAASLASSAWSSRTRAPTPGPVGLPRSVDGAASTSGLLRRRLTFPATCGVRKNARRRRRRCSPALRSPFRRACRWSAGSSSCVSAARVQRSCPSGRKDERLAPAVTLHGRDVFSVRADNRTSSHARTAAASRALACRRKGAVRRRLAWEAAVDLAEHPTCVVRRERRWRRVAEGQRRRSTVVPRRRRRLRS